MPGRRRSGIPLLLGALGLAVLLAGCDGTVQPVPRATGPLLSLSPAPSATPAEVVTGEFEEPVRLANGLVVTVTSLGSFTPSATAVAPRAPSYERFQIRLRNRSGTAFNPALVEASVVDDRGSALQVLDSESDLNGPPGRDLLPDATARWDVAFGLRSQFYRLRVALNDRAGDVVEFAGDLRS